MTDIVKVRYLKDGALSDREYTYFSESPLTVGQELTVPVRDTTGLARVTAIDVPEARIRAFRDKVKMIPAAAPAKVEAETGSSSPVVGVTWVELGPATATTTKTRKNPDYSKSAVKLVNPPEVKTLLEKLHEWQAQAEVFRQDIQTILDQEHPGLLDGQAYCVKEAAALREQLEAAIEKHGSCQDVKAGEYAIKMRKVAVSYDAAKFEANFPKAAPMVITKAVNVKALEGLIKGKVIDEADLKEAGVAIEAESFAYKIQ